MVTNTQSQPQPSVSDVAPLATVTVVPPKARKGKAGNSLSNGDMFREDRERHARLATLKAKLMGSVRQQLAQVQDADREAGDKTASATESREKASAGLYEGLTKGVFSREEVSSMLVDIFGAVPRKDGTAGRTPKGTGAAIRMRVFRAHEAADFATTRGGGSAFFKGLPKGEVGDVVTALEKGGSVWTAYDKLAKLKASNRVSVPLAYDAKAITKIVETLANAKSAGLIARNASLRSSYAALSDVLASVGREGAKLLAKAK